MAMTDDELRENYRNHLQVFDDKTLRGFLRVSNLRKSTDRKVLLATEVMREEAEKRGIKV